MVVAQWRCLASNAVDLIWGILCSNLVNTAACDGAGEGEQCELEEAACEDEACLVPSPSIARGRGLPRLAMRTARRRFAGMGHAVWEVSPNGRAMRPTDSAAPRSEQPRGRALKERQM